MSNKTLTVREKALVLNYAQTHRAAQLFTRCGCSPANGDTCGHGNQATIRRADIASWGSDPDVSRELRLVAA